MAGIGFELQRALRGGGLVKALTVAISGVVIVAGPWLVSIAGISILTGTASFVLTEGQDLFIGVIVYGYAFSTCMFGGAHYVFTRYISDLLYDKKNHRITAAFVLMLILVAVLSAGVAIPFALNLQSTSVTQLVLFRAGMVLFFVAINLIWIGMLVITILKRFVTIIGAYLAGMAVSVWGSVFLGGRYGLGGALSGFALGQTLVAVFMLAIMIRWSTPSSPLKELRSLLAYAKRYTALLFSGWLYSAGLWVDKIIFWMTLGFPVRGTFIRLYESYDLAAYIANLSVIPVLVFFTIFTETTFYAGLRRFLLKLGTSIYSKIAEEKYTFRKASRKIILEQFYFHGLLALILLILLHGLLVKVLIIAVFFHMIFLTFFTFLFYLESYGSALRGSLLFFGLNFTVTLASVYFARIPHGTGYLVAGLCAGVYTGIALFRNLNSLDRIIFSRN
jgi:uncharacterized membrane protein